MGGNRAACWPRTCRYYDHDNGYLVSGELLDADSEESRALVTGVRQSASWYRGTSGNAGPSLSSRMSEH